MTKRTLSDAQQSIQRFIFEARRCAEQELGFAALSTTFPAALAVTEAVIKAIRASDASRRDERITTKYLMKMFVPFIGDRASWLITPSASISDDELAIKLADIRDSLAHQLSLPTDVFLTNTSSDIREASRERPDKYVISTVEFINAVEKALQHIIGKHPNVEFDREPRIKRAPANRVHLMRTSGSSGSSGSEITRPPSD